MADNLVIVESPAKAKTIGKFLGSDYTVTSSMGHVRDLVKKDMGIDIDADNHTFTPLYEVTPDKVDLVAQLRKDAKKAQKVWLASDEDREGESIAWHLCVVLGLDPAKCDRIVFHEITKTAIDNAINNPRKIDMDLVDAQQARRVLDRIVGYELSPILWRKVKPNLSAGRVQSVTVRLLVDRENEIRNFVSTKYFNVTASFAIEAPGGKDAVLKTALSQHLSGEAEAEELLKHCATAAFSVADISTKPVVRKPAPPFTTSTLQQDAARKLGYTVKRTMQIAQHLYEDGKITYMRTDSVNLSTMALAACKEVICNEFGPQYHQFRQYHTTSKGAQEAHEAIRPTFLANRTIQGTAEEVRLYELIWKRTVASQMQDASLERTQVKVAISGDDRTLNANGEVVKFDGFLKLYIESSDDDGGDESSLLPPLSVGQPLRMPTLMEARERYTLPPARYNEASLVKQLESFGIGRPSTYAPTISTVQTRGYVERTDIEGTPRQVRLFVLDNGSFRCEDLSEVFGSERGKLRPTDIGKVVTGFLVEKFPEVLDYKFTADEEKNFDSIASGEAKWEEVIDNFFVRFNPVVRSVAEEEGPKVGERELGQDPDSGKPVFAKIGRFGPLVQIGSADDEDKPRFAGLRKGQSLESITLEEALELFKLPRVVGSYEDMDITVAEGRFGPYVKHNGLFYSLKKGDDPMSVDLARCIQVIEMKREEERNRVIAQFDADDIAVLNGRFGPYIVHDGVNYKIPKGTDAHALSLDDCKAIVSADDQKNVLRSFPEAGIKIRKARFGAVLIYNKKEYALSREFDPAACSAEQCLAIAAEQDEKKSKKSAKSTSKTSSKSSAKSASKSSTRASKTTKSDAAAQKADSPKPRASRRKKSDDAG